jgi:hypothetical protein
MIGTKYGNGLQDLPYIIPREKQCIVPPSFRGDFSFYISANQQNGIAHDDLVVLSNSDKIL